MTEPKRLSFDGPQIGAARVFLCGAPGCHDECESFFSSATGRRTYTARCRLHGELEYSAAWQRRLAASTDEHQRDNLFAERGRWVAKGHLFRGTSEREYVDRRAGTE